MIPGPDQVIACPQCEGLARYGTLMSGNTMGARGWTDGRQIAPMLPTPPAVVRCRHCSTCYWLADAEEVGAIAILSDDTADVDPAWADAEDVEEPTEDEYYAAIANGLAATSEQEREARISAWWRRNDRFRDHPPEGPDADADDHAPWRANLRSLAGLLDEEDDGDRLMKAEVLRQLGEFAPARQVLDGVVSPDLAPVVSQFRSLCDARDTCVRELR